MTIPVTIKTSLLLPLVIAVLFTSCSKVNESIQRDIILTPSGVDFTIPIVPTTTSSITIGELTSPLSLDAEISKIDPRFKISNIKDVRITGFQIDLLDYVDETGNPAEDDDTDDEEEHSVFDDNNLGNLEELHVEISANDIKATIASVFDNPSTKSGSIKIPTNVSALNLKEILTAASFKYSVIIKARKVTTIALKARATPTYTITVGL